MFNRVISSYLVSFEKILFRISARKTSLFRAKFIHWTGRTLCNFSSSTPHSFARNAFRLFLFELHIEGHRDPSASMLIIFMEFVESRVVISDLIASIAMNRREIVTSLRGVRKLMRLRSN
jgi:hypothetical protein